MSSSGDILLENSHNKDFAPEINKTPERIPRDAAYLMQQVGPCLTKALAEIVEKQPRDPIEYLAHYLKSHVDTISHIEKMSRLNGAIAEEETELDSEKKASDECRQEQSELLEQERLELEALRLAEEEALRAEEEARRAEEAARIAKANAELLGEDAALDVATEEEPAAEPADETPAPVVDEPAADNGTDANTEPEANDGDADAAPEESSEDNDAEKTVDNADSEAPIEPVTLDEEQPAAEDEEPIAAEE